MSKQNQQLKLSEAIRYASHYHEGILDKGGKPYILHCLQVMNWVKSKDPEVMQIAVMHDLIEDTAVTEESLRYCGFSERVISALVLLTHIPGQSYEGYIQNILENKDAMLVKMADLKHNSDITRLKGVEGKDLARIAMYHKSYLLIKETLKSL